MGSCVDASCSYKALLVETARRIQKTETDLAQLPRYVQELQELDASVARAIKSEARCDCGHYVLSHNANGCFTLEVRDGGVHTPCPCKRPHGNWTAKPRNHAEALALVLEYLGPLTAKCRADFFDQLHSAYCRDCGREA